MKPAPTVTVFNDVRSPSPNPDDLVLSVLGHVYYDYMDKHPDARKGLVFVIENAKGTSRSADVNVIATTIDQLLATNAVSARLPEEHATVLLAACSSPLTFGVLYLTPKNICSYEILHADVQVSETKNVERPIWIAPSVGYQQ